MVSEYIVNKGRSIVVKRGVLGPGKEITPKDTKNFEKLLEKEWIIKKENLIVVKEEDINIVPEPEKIKEPTPEEVKKTKNKKANKNKGAEVKSQFGAIRKEEVKEEVEEVKEIEE